MNKYKIVRMFFNDFNKSITIKRNLNSDQAMAWCSDPETSSSTCKSAKKLAYTKKHGQWFDAFDDQ